MSLDQSSLKELQDKLELLERQLQVDTESSKMLSNEKTLFLKRVADLEAQVLTLEEENEGLKGECAQARQWAQRLTGQVQAIGEQSVQCEGELKDLAAIITEEQQHRTQMEQMVEALEFSVKRYRRGTRSGGEDSLILILILSIIAATVVMATKAATTTTAANMSFPTVLRNCRRQREHCRRMIQVLQEVALAPSTPTTTTPPAGRSDGRCGRTSRSCTCCRCR